MFADGLYIWFFAFQKKPISSYPQYYSGGFVGQLYLDINGPKNPNTFGRDIFFFYLGNNGILYPFASQAVSEMLRGNPNTDYWKTNPSRNDCNPTGYGSSCAARVLEEDAMNY